MPQGPLGLNTKIGGAGAFVPNQAGKSGDLLVGDAVGKYYESAYSGACGIGANPSGVTTSAGLATTYVGLCLSNPAASGKNLSVQRVSGAFIVAPSTITGINLIVGWAAGGITVHTTALTVLNAKLGVATPALVGLVDSACTLVGTPAYAMPVGQSPTAIISPAFNLDLDGAILIPPGGYLAIGTTIAGPTSGFQGGIMWKEIPA